MRKVAKNIIFKSLKIARRYPKFQNILEQENLENNLREGWGKIEPIFTEYRRHLFKDPTWRYGSNRVKEVAKEAFDAISQFVSVEDKNYCDLGCGSYHPFGISALMYINGAASTIAIDIDGTDDRRAAEALYDVLVECLATPSAWHWSTLKLEDFLARIRHFELEALRNGDLEAGIARLPLKHLVTNINDCSLPFESIDLMSSRAVLEHFLDFEVATKKLYSLTSTGGIAYHHIDLRDHRAYVNPSMYHWWSFLAESDDWSDGLTNRLRFSEIRQCFEQEGFEILHYEGRTEEMPEGFREKLKGRFAAMTDEELSITGVFCVLRKNKT